VSSEIRIDGLFSDELSITNSHGGRHLAHRVFHALISNGFTIVRKPRTLDNLYRLNRTTNLVDGGSPKAVVLCSSSEVILLVIGLHPNLGCT
jgi:hypothetical protein